MAYGSVELVSGAELHAASCGTRSSSSAAPRVISDTTRPGRLSLSLSGRRPPAARGVDAHALHLHDPTWPIIRRIDPTIADRLGRDLHPSETRAFFAPRAGGWEHRFPDDDPAYAAAVGELGLRAGQTALDLGCGTGRALPHLARAVGPRGCVLGLDLTPEMLTAARRHGRHAHALLVLADARRLPPHAGVVDGAFAPPGTLRSPSRL